VDTTQDTTQPAPATQPALEENEEAIADLAGILAECDSIEALRILRETFAPSLLAKASKCLVKSHYEKIWEWVKLLNSSPDFSGA
jgi:hypothetical protein